MRVFHFLNEQYGLKALRDRRLKISRIHELNDPFEFLGVELSDREFRKALKRTKDQLSERRGLLCFSKDWRNPVLWAHYADKHRGLSLGFDIPVHLLDQVTYVKSRLRKPKELDEAFLKKLLFTKFVHWSYEAEYRAYVTLDTPIEGVYYKEFSDDLLLRQVIVGAESKVTRAQVAAALGSLVDCVEAFKVRAGFREFRIVHQQRESLWA